MSSSFQHTIVRLTAESEETINREHGGGPGQVPAWSSRCSGSTREKLCTNRIKWACGWRYVTGAAGRVSWAQRNYCDDHARKFCKSHRLQIPEELLPTAPAEVKQ
jgi:hypothetical protein